MKRLRLYLDTTVWNYSFATDTPEKQAHTVDFFQRVRYGLFEVFASRAVLDELERAPDPRRTLMEDLWVKTKPASLEITPEVRELALLYLQRRALPARSEADALHVALTTIYQMDALVSWNFQHLSNIKRRAKLAAVNLSQGYTHPLELINPLEVLDEAEG